MERRRGRGRRGGEKERKGIKGVGKIRRRG